MLIISIIICLIIALNSMYINGTHQTYTNILEKEFNLKEEPGKIIYSIEYENKFNVTYYINPKDKKAFEQKIKEFGEK